MSQLRELIKKGQLEQALKLLANDCIDADLQREAEALLGGFQSKKREKRMGILTNSEYDLFFNQTVHKALELHKECEGSVEESSNIDRNDLLKRALELVEEEDIELLFDLLNKRGIKAASLSKLKKEFIKGVHKTDSDYTDRLKMALKRTLGNR